MGNTAIVDATQAGWRTSFLADYPFVWTNQTPGNGLYEVASACAALYEVINQLMIYAFNACRIETATDTALDTCAEDYYGDEKPRKPAEPDVNYRSRILAGLLLEKVTVAGLRLVLTQLTGTVPRILEPWNAGDTACYDNSYYDVDLPAIPGRYGDTGTKYTVCILSELPNSNPAGASPIWGYDAGAAYDSYTGVFWQTLNANFLELTDLYQAIVETKAAGISAYLQLIPSGLVTWILSNTMKLATNSVGGTPSIQPIAGPYCVLLSGGWNSTFWTFNFNKTNYSLGLGTPAPSGANTINTALLPFTVPGAGFLLIPPGSPYTIPVNQPAANGANLLIATPNWDTTVWITAVGPTSTTVAFGTPPPPGAGLSTYWAPSSATQSVAGGSINIGIVMSKAGIPFVIPSWNTTVAITQTGANLLVSFNVPAPVGSFVQWAVL